MYEKSQKYLIYVLFLLMTGFLFLTFIEPINLLYQSYCCCFFFKNRLFLYYPDLILWNLMKFSVPNSHAATKP